jgi:hypothetical protein
MRRQQSDGEPEFLLAFTRHVLFVDAFGQQTRAPIVLDRLPLEHGLLGDTLVTSYCDMVRPNMEINVEMN